MTDAIVHRVTECKASQDDRLWIRFDDGLEGRVFLGNCLEVRAFHGWRDAGRFCRVAVDPVAANVVWDDGIRFDPDILYQGLLSGRPGKGFSSPGLAPAVE
jgi:hypothetical protein